MKPFSKNIIFVDTEFSSLNPYKGEILSIGMVKLNGEELYLELKHNGKVDKWVAKNITPHLKDVKLTRKRAITKIKNFVTEKEPFMVSYIGQFDVIYLYKLFGIGNEPFYWIPIDFASILFALGLSPGSYSWEDKDNFYKKIGVDHSKYRKHHALDDAKLLRDVYLKFFEKYKNIKSPIKTNAIDKNKFTQRKAKS